MSSDTLFLTVQNVAHERPVITANGVNFKHHK